MEEVRRWASDICSGDIAEAMKGRQALGRFMAPENLLEMWRGDSKEMALKLLSEAETTGSPEVYALLGESLRRLFDPHTGRAVAEEFLLLDDSFIVLRFILSAVAHEDVMRAGRLRDALVGLLGVLPVGLGPAAGKLFDASLRNERVLRLFDENHPQSDENAKVCSFLSLNTSLLSFIADSTLDAFENDPLLVANYLVVCGIISRYAEMPKMLIDKIGKELAIGVDSFIFPFVCRACAIVISNHEANASKFAGMWCAAVATHLAVREPGAREAIYDIFGAASSTLAGWSAARDFVQCDDMVVGLKLNKLRDCVLSFMSTLVQFPHVPAELFSQPLLSTAWQLRTSLDESVRQNLWEFVVRSLLRESLIPVMLPLCVSYLCSSSEENVIAIRALQLEAAKRLADSSELPPEMFERLQRYISRGLYPPGSVGVEALPR